MIYKKSSHPINGRYFKRIFNLIYSYVNEIRKSEKCLSYL